VSNFLGAVHLSLLSEVYFYCKSGIQKRTLALASDPICAGAYLQKYKIPPFSPDRSGNPFLSRFFFGSKKIETDSGTHACKKHQIFLLQKKLIELRFIPFT
jgi:hypothetical protein